MTSLTDTRTASAATPSKHYGTGAIAFHWSVGLLVLFLGVEGWAIDLTPKTSKDFWTNIHATVGALTFVLLIGRIWWRTTHKPPELPSDTSKLVRVTSHAVHMLLYVGLVVVCIAGFVNIFARGRGIDFGAFQIGPLMTASRAVVRPADTWHVISSYAVLAVAVGHILAALWHHFIQHDDILLRMMSPAKK